MLLILIIAALGYNEPALANKLEAGFLPLKEVEKSVMEKSLDLQAKSFEVEAAKEKRSAIQPNFMPKITLDGTYKYVSEVPEINMAPGKTLKFGDNKNFSIGPTLTLTLFDYNSKSHLRDSIGKEVSSKENDLKSLRSASLYQVRFHYLNLVLLMEKRNLIQESLAVAKYQLKDVSAKKRYGSGTKLDFLTAQKEVHELESQDKEIKFNILAERTELLKISNLEKLRNLDLINLESPTKLESLENLAIAFSRFKTSQINEKSNFKIKAISELAESLESQATAINNSKFPKITLFARTSYDYPNGPTLEQFNQNTIGLNLSMPLLDGGETNHNVSEKKMLANALKLRARNEERNIIDSTDLMIKRIENLNEQSEIIKNKINETSEISRLMFLSYREGRLTFLEVERANIKSREEKLSLKSNRYKTIINLLQLAALAGE